MFLPIPFSLTSCVSLPPSSPFSYLSVHFYFFLPDSSSHVSGSLALLLSHFCLYHIWIPMSSLTLDALSSLTLLSFSLYLSNLLLSSHVPVTLPEAGLSELSQRVRLDCKNGKFNKSHRESELGWTPYAPLLICSPGCVGEDETPVSLCVLCVPGQGSKNNIRKGATKGKVMRNVFNFFLFSLHKCSQIKPAGVCRLPLFPSWRHLLPWTWMLLGCWAGLRDSRILQRACGTSSIY